MSISVSRPVDSPELSLKAEVAEQLRSALKRSRASTKSIIAFHFDMGEVVEDMAKIAVDKIGIDDDRVKSCFAEVNGKRWREFPSVILTSSSIREDSALLTSSVPLTCC